MPPSKNVIAATLTKGQAAQAGVVDANQAVEAITTNSKRMYGFTRKQTPKGMPTEPKTYVYSISEYGEIVNLGPGMRLYEVLPCMEGEDYGEPCVIDPVNFFEEAKVDVTEHTFQSAEEICGAIMRMGPGMNASNDRRKVGWFVSPSYPPTPEEVESARQIYATECQRLMNLANGYAAAGQLKEINETHRRAAKYLKQKVDWDKPNYRMIECVGCQEPIRAITVVHAIPSCGAVQIGPDGEPLWEQAIKLGLKKLRDAPDEVQEMMKNRKKSAENNQN